METENSGDDMESGNLLEKQDYRPDGAQCYY